MGIKVHGSLFILKYAVLKKIISREKAFKILLEMVKKMVSIFHQKSSHFLGKI